MGTSQGAPTTDPPPRPWIKVCGWKLLPSPQTVPWECFNAVGLNFYERSPRAISPALAGQFAAGVPAHVARFGVFVNRTVDSVLEIAKTAQLTHLQIHGDESIDWLADLNRRSGGMPIVRALRAGPGEMAAVDRTLREIERAGVRLWAVLIDARSVDPQQYGGSGHTAPWSELASFDRSPWPPLILAGGLTPANAGAAVRAVRPWGVDAASGVETAPGVKSPLAIRQFVEAAREAAVG